MKLPKPNDSKDLQAAISKIDAEKDSIGYTAVEVKLMKHCLEAGYLIGQNDMADHLKL